MKPNAESKKGWAGEWAKACNKRVKERGPDLWCEWLQRLRQRYCSLHTLRGECGAPAFLSASQRPQAASQNTSCPAMGAASLPLERKGEDGGNVLKCVGEKHMRFLYGCLTTRCKLRQGREKRMGWSRNSTCYWINFNIYGIWKNCKL